MTALSLISPIGSNFIKDWPAQNQVNLDRIDTFAGQCLLAQPLGTYSPLLNGTSTDPTLGTGGFIKGYYYRIWDQVYTWGEWRFGSAGINIGSGVYFISIPFPADLTFVGATSFPGGGSSVGGGVLWDASTDSGKRPLIAQLRDNNSLQFMHPMGDTGNELINSGSPLTFTNSDGMSWFASYKRI